MADGSLDDYIKTNHITRSGTRGASSGRFRGRPMRGRGGGFRTQNAEDDFSGGLRSDSFRNQRKQPFYFNRGPRGMSEGINGQWTHDMFGSGASGAKGLMGGFGQRTGGDYGEAGAKLLVSNLDFGVSEHDIRELFGEFGDLKRASLHFDQDGRSLGTAEVLFHRRSDAMVARNKYNGVPLDGRIMRIELVGAGSADGMRGGGGFGPDRMPRFVPRGGGWSGGVGSGSTMGYGRGGNRNNFSRGGNRGGGRGGFKKGKDKTEITLEELDMELDEMSKQAA